MLPDHQRDRWLDRAVSGIRFKPDRKAVRAELEAHMEDKMADLQRIFPDIPEEEAQERVLAGMGDPEEVREKLAKVHRPWLGYLWAASRWIVWGLWFLFLIVGWNRNSTIDGSIWGRMSDRAMYHRIYDGEKARLGGYTFRIIGAAYVDRPEEYGGEDSLQLTLRVSTPRFWERVDGDAVLAGLSAAGPDGVWEPMDRQSVIMRDDTDYWPSSTWSTRVWKGGALCRWGPGWEDFSLCVSAEGWQSGDRMSLKFECGLGSFTLSAPVTEKVAVP